MAYELKTKPTKVTVTKFLADQSEERKKECKAIIALMKRVTKQPAKMWGPSIVGFGKFHYEYASGHEGDMPEAAFAARKANLVVYVTQGFDGQQELLARLGKHKASRGCLYINKLADVDLEALEGLVRLSWEGMRAKYPG